MLLLPSGKVCASSGSGCYMLVYVTPGILYCIVTTRIKLPSPISGDVHVCIHVRLQIQERYMSALHMLIIRSSYTTHVRMHYTFPRYLYHVKMHTMNNTSNQQYGMYLYIVLCIRYVPCDM